MSACATLFLLAAASLTEFFASRACSRDRSWLRCRCGRISECVIMNRERFGGKQRSHMTTQERVRDSFIDGAFHATPVDPDYTQRAKAPGRLANRICSDVRCKNLIYGSAIKTSLKPQEISHLQISNRRFPRGLAFTSNMTSASLHHFSFHGIIGLLCSQ
jgi:hypothetical protein